MVTTESTADGSALPAYVERAREEHAQALRSLEAARRIIETLEQLGNPNARDRSAARRH